MATIRCKLILDVEATFDDNESTAETVAFCVVDDLTGLAPYTIHSCEPADVAPVVQGRWVARHISGEDPYACSICGNSVNVCGYKYCPSCGARMEGGGV